MRSNQAPVSQTCWTASHSHSSSWPHAVEVTRPEQFVLPAAKRAKVTGWCKDITSSRYVQASSLTNRLTDACTSAMLTCFTLAVLPAEPCRLCQMMRPLTSHEVGEEAADGVRGVADADRPGAEAVVDVIGQRLLRQSAHSACRPIASRVHDPASEGLD